MNLYTKSDGLLDTHITWKDIEEALKLQLQTEASFGKNKTLKNIGDGKGFLSRICLVEPDWQGAKPVEELPKTFVVKLCSLLNFVAVMEPFKVNGEYPPPILGFFDFMAASTKKMHNLECFIYDYMKDANLQIPRTKAITSSSITEANPLKGFIVLEYVKDIHAIHLHNYISVENVKQALEASAEWSAMSLAFTEDERKQFSTAPFKEIFGVFFSAQSAAQLISSLKTLDDGRLSDKADQLEKLIPVLHNFEYYDNITKTIGMTPVLCHGDLWSSNLLWRKRNDDLDLAGIIDFQTAHFGSPAIDICRIICASLNKTERHTNFENLVKFYYNKFTESLGEYEAPFTQDQLLESCKRLMPLSSYMIVSMMPTLIETFLKTPEENEASSRAISKVGELLDDTFTYLERYPIKE